MGVGGGQGRCVTTEEARRLRRPAPAGADLDDEEEVDLGRYASAVAARWWLPLLGLLCGAVLAYLVSLGASDVYRAQALVYLGVPLAPNGGGQLQGLATNPAAVREIVRSEAAVQRAARESGLRAAELRTGISVQTASAGTAAARALSPSLVNVIVRGDTRGRVATAANALARSVVDQVSARYVDERIEILRAQIAQAEAELRAVDAQVAAAQAAARGRGLSASERLLALIANGQALQRRSIVQQSLLDRRQLLSLAENVERSRIVEPAVARKVTAQSRRNAVVAGGAIGLILGLVAALAWDVIARRVGRMPA